MYTISEAFCCCHVAQAETLEDLYKWKIALEDALARAPNFSFVTGQNGSWRNVHSNLDDACFEQRKHLIKMCSYFLMQLQHCSIT